MILDPKRRKVPQIPPKEQRLRVLIDSDAKNEIDDQWAIALALLSPERFDIEGFVGANFANSFSDGPDSVAQSVREIELLLDKAGLAGRYPVYPGSHPMRYPGEPSPSEGVAFIVERAMAGGRRREVARHDVGTSSEAAAARFSDLLARLCPGHG